MFCFCVYIRNILQLPGEGLLVTRIFDRASVPRLGIEFGNAVDVLMLAFSVRIQGAVVGCCSWKPVAWVLLGRPEARVANLSGLESFGKSHLTGPQSPASKEESCLEGESFLPGMQGKTV